jgi:hypothetical protein
MPKGIRKVPIPTRYCVIVGCGKKHRSGGYCQHHYNNWYKRGDPLAKGILGAHATHGKTHSPEWNTWQGMKKRCSLVSRHDYHRYGGRGITVCDRWRDSFENFFADMGLRPSASHSLDRINNDGNYEPSNCRWATTNVQASNRSDNVTLTHGGVTLTLMEWSLRLGRDYSTIWRRLRKPGWTVEDALFKPLKFSQAECYARKRAF